MRTSVKMRGGAVGTTVVVAVVVLVAGSALPWLMPRAGVDQVESILSHLQAAILFGAASLGLLSGRWAARTSVGFACAALLVLAFAGAVSGTAVGQTGFGPVMSTGGAALAVALLLAAAAAPEVKDAESFGRVLTRESGPFALLALVALTPVVDALLVAGMTMPVPVRMVYSALAAAALLVAGTLVYRFDRQRFAWLPAVLVILAMEAVARAFVGVWPGSLLVAVGLEALAGAFALVGAAMAARAALVSTDRRDDEHAAGPERDAGPGKRTPQPRRANDCMRFARCSPACARQRAVFVSTRTASTPVCGGGSRTLSARSWSRLNHLIDPGISDATEELDLEAVVMSVVVAEREQGLVVTTDLADVSVQGRAAEIATLVSDLLVNARMHAPGSAVRLTAGVDGDVVTLKVRDWGPGLSASDAEHVFERSYRGARPIAAGVPGSGLGLYNARKLARQMQGDLQLRAPEGGGCCFVATLPVAPKGDDEVLEALESQWPTDRSQFAEMNPRRGVRIHHRTDSHDEGLPLSC